MTYFYDAKVRKAPTIRQEFFDSRCVEVRHTRKALRFNKRRLVR